MHAPAFLFQPSFSLAHSQPKMLRLSVKRAFSSSALRGDNIGFIGLGNMGAHMARNLLKAKHSVTVFDINPAAVAALKEAGATVRSSMNSLLPSPHFMVD